MIKQGKYRVSRNYLNPGYKNNINPSVARKEASTTKSDGCRYQLSFIGATPASVVPVTNNVRVSSILLVDERHTLADSLLIERNQFMMALRQRLLQAFYHTFQCNHRAHFQERAEHNHIVRFRVFHLQCSVHSRNIVDLYVLARWSAMNAVVVIDEYASRLHLALKLVKALLVEHHSDVESVKNRRAYLLIA